MKQIIKKKRHKIISLEILKRTRLIYLWKLISCLFILYYLVSCGTKTTLSTAVDRENCLRIDTLIKEQYFGKTNYHANRIIPILEKESGICSKSKKGFTGYFYKNDSIFDNDIKKWQIYFKCR